MYSISETCNLPKISTTKIVKRNFFFYMSYAERDHTVVARRPSSCKVLINTQLTLFFPLDNIHALTFGNELTI